MTGYCFECEKEIYDNKYWYDDFHFCSAGCKAIYMVQQHKDLIEELYARANSREWLLLPKFRKIYKLSEEEADAKLAECYVAYINQCKKDGHNIFDYNEESEKNNGSIGTTFSLSFNAYKVYNSQTFEVKLNGHQYSSDHWQKIPEDCIDDWKSLFAYYIFNGILTSYGLNRSLTYYKFNIYNYLTSKYSPDSPIGKKLEFLEAEKQKAEDAKCPEAAKIKSIINPILTKYAQEQGKTYYPNVKPGENGFKENDELFYSYLTSLLNAWVAEKYNESESFESVDKSLAGYVQRRFNALGDASKKKMSFKDDNGVETEMSVYFGIPLESGCGIHNIQINSTDGNGVKYLQGGKRVGSDRMDVVLAYLFKKGIAKRLKHSYINMRDNNTSEEKGKEIVSKLPVDFRYSMIKLFTSEIYKYLKEKYAEQPDSPVGKILAEIQAESDKLKK